MTGGTHGAPVGDGRPRARITFTAFPSADDPMLLAWTRFRGPFATAPRRHAALPSPDSGAASAAPPPVAGGVQVLGLWRLLASNNRELGRSFRLYRSFDSARSHVQRLQFETTELEVALIAGPANGSQGWVVLHEGVPVMTCGRWYHSSSTGVSSATGALTALSTAVLAQDVDRSTPSGRFARRLSVRDHADAW